MSKWPWPERLKRIVFSSPASSAARAVSSAPRIACDASGAEGSPRCARTRRRREAVALEVGLGADEPVADELGDQRRDAVVAQTAGVDRRRDEVVPERVHRDERRQLARVAEVVGEEAARERRAGGRLAREHVDVAAGDLLAQEREGKPGEVRAAADAADHDVREGARLLHLRQSLLPDHGLVQEDVVQHGAERVGGVLALRCVLDRLRDRDPETARRVRMLLEHGPPGLRVLGRARTISAPHVWISERRNGFWSYEILTM